MKGGSVKRPHIIMKDKKVIYGDWAATAPVFAEVAEAMRPFLFIKDGEGGFGNPSSLHDLGMEAKAALRRAREQTAQLIGASPEEVFFTSCATESINWAVKGAAFRALAEGDSRRRLLVSAIEHPAVHRTCEALTPFGFRTEYVPVDENGVVSLAEFERMVGKDCLLCAVMHANNETGVIQPVEKCAEIAHANGAWFLCDGVQTVGHIPVDVKKLGCDFFPLSGHKLGAPKGVGALYVKKGTTLPPLLHGGGQENGCRSGTENVPGIVGMGCACALCGEDLLKGEEERIGSLRNRIEGVLSALGGTVNGGKVPRVPGILNVSFDDIGGESLMLLCSLYGVCISTGSACSLGHGDGVSHVLRAMKLSEERANGSVRISLGRGTTVEDADEIAAVAEKCIRSIRGEPMGG